MIYESNKDWPENIEISMRSILTDQNKYDQFRIIHIKHLLKIYDNNM